MLYYHYEGLLTNRVITNQALSLKSWLIDFISPLMPGNSDKVMKKLSAIITAGSHVFRRILFRLTFSYASFLHSPDEKRRR